MRDSIQHRYIERLKEFLCVHEGGKPRAHTWKYHRELHDFLKKMKRVYKTGLGASPPLKTFFSIFMNGSNRWEKACADTCISLPPKHCRAFAWMIARVILEEPMTPDEMLVWNITQNIIDEETGETDIRTIAELSGATVSSAVASSWNLPGLEKEEDQDTNLASHSIIDVIDDHTWDKLTAGLHTKSVKRLEFLLEYLDQAVKEKSEDLLNESGNMFVPLGTFIEVKREFYHYLDNRPVSVRSIAVRKLLGRLDDYGIILLRMEGRNLTIAVRVHEDEMIEHA